MIAVAAVVMVGLVLLALIGRDVWLRTLEARTKALAETERKGIDRALSTLADRCAALETGVKHHHDRLLAQERKIPAPRRA